MLYALLAVSGITFLLLKAQVSEGFTLIIKLWNAWKRYFVEPQVYASQYTTRSRNYVNLGMMALMLSPLFVVGPHTLQFVISNPTEAQVLELPRVEGEWLSQSNYKSVSPCIVKPATKIKIACTTMFMPRHTGPESQHRPAVGYVYPHVGIVSLEVDGRGVLSIDEARSYFLKRALSFYGLLSFAVLAIGFAIYRQRTLLKKRGG